MFPSISGLSSGVFSKDELPFGASYNEWAKKFWTWQSETFTDQENSGNWVGVEENGCFLRDEGPLVMLIDPAVGYNLNQNCTISSNQGILIDLWSGECDQAMKEYANATVQELSDCARTFNYGKVHSIVKVDGMPVAELGAVDKVTNILKNASEVRTSEFNLTLDKNTRIPTDEDKLGGTYLAGTHGWYVILKPLAPGSHTIYYQNSVEPTTLSGAGNVNAAQITYHLNVK